MIARAYEDVNRLVIRSQRAVDIPVIDRVDDLRKGWVRRADRPIERVSEPPDFAFPAIPLQPRPQPPKHLLVRRPHHEVDGDFTALVFDAVRSSSTSMMSTCSSRS